MTEDGKAPQVVEKSWDDPISPPLPTPRSVLQAVQEQQVSPSVDESTAHVGVRHDPQLSAGWEPIETAPRDGTKVLCSNVGRGMLVFIAKYIRPYDRWPIEPDDEAWWRRDGASSREAWGVRPTHWRPLPDPPLSEGEGKT